MAVTTAWFGGAFRDKEANVSNAPWLFLTDTIKCSLHTVTYAYNVDTNKFWSDTSNEVSSTNYTTKGIALTTKTITYDTASNETRYDADDPAWTTVTFTTREAIIFKDTGTSSTSPLIAVIDFGADQTVSGGNFSINFAATGFMKAVS